MITLIVPTRNRLQTLSRVLDSYFEQADVSQLVFVIDAGSDATPDLLASAALRFPHKHTVVLINEVRKGASQSRNIGVSVSTNEYILFCDDDEFLEPSYAKICLEKLLSYNAAAVSGRRVYMLGQESPQAAVQRFGNGIRSIGPFNRLLCEFANGARYSGDIELPITNAVILTKRSLLLQYPFDSHYHRGNGYREETDYQMNLYVHGHKIIVTNDCHSIHLPMHEVRTGGQRTSKFKRIYWSIYYTRYFYSKYFKLYSRRVGMHAPQWSAILAFGIFAIYREFVRPIFYQIWMRTRTRT